MLTLSQNGDGRDLPHRSVYEESFRTYRQTRRNLWRSITKNNFASHYDRVKNDSGRKEEEAEEYDKEEKKWYEDDSS